MNEPFGPTLAQWLDGASLGKVERLAAIRQMLGLPPEMMELSATNFCIVQLLRSSRRNGSPPAPRR